MDKAKQELQHELTEAKKEIVRGDGNLDTLKSEAEEASQEAATRLTSEEKRGLHDGLFTAINLAMQTKECQEPYSKYVAEMQSLGRTYMPPGKWATGMMGLVAKHHEAPLPNQKSPQSTPQYPSHPQDPEEVEPSSEEESEPGDTPLLDEDGNPIPNEGLPPAPAPNAEGKTPSSLQGGLKAWANVRRGKPSKDPNAKKDRSRSPPPAPDAP